MKIEAPYPAIQVSSTFPNPTYANSVNVEVEVQKRVSINNVKRTYVKAKDRYRLLFVLSLSSAKSYELYNLVAQYMDSDFLITDHDGVQWVAKWTGPVDFPFIWKTRDHRSEINLEFQGRKL